MRVMEQSDRALRGLLVLSAIYYIIHDGIESLVNDKFDNGSQNIVKKPQSKKDSI